MIDFETKSAIDAAANTGDNAVADHIFADKTTVIVDSKKVVDEPFSIKPKKDGYNANGWKNFGNSFIALNRWWTNGIKVGGYYSLTESDIWYNLDYKWTTSLSTAQMTSNHECLQRTAKDAWKRRYNRSADSLWCCIMVPHKDA